MMIAREPFDCEEEAFALFSREAVAYPSGDAASVAANFIEFVDMVLA